MIRNNCIEFGRDLLRTGDLDPLYIMLYCAQPDRKTLGRFILAYSMFYHAGVAARLATENDFWDGVYVGIDNWPRGTERRHWRGKIAMDTYNEMSQYEPEVILKSWKPDDRTFRKVFSAVKAWKGYGPWIAFKIADIMERTGYYKVDFAGADLSIYRDPMKGAALYCTGDQDGVIKQEHLTWALNDICEHLQSYKAPPLYDRPIDIQEAETILCKFKSHYNGHYPVGKDTREILHGLQGWGDFAEQLGKAVLL